MAENTHIHAVVDWLYFQSANLLPLSIDRWTGGTWVGTYVMRARFYFEVMDSVGGPHWPWKWGRFLDDGYPS